MASVKVLTYMLAKSVYAAIVNNLKHYFVRDLDDEWMISNIVAQWMKEVIILFFLRPGR